MTDTAPSPHPLDRPICDALPPDARRVLDAGCGAGVLGALIRQVRPGCTVVGIEADPAAAAAAASRLDSVLTLDIDGAMPPLEPRSFDAVICDRVLERCADPVAALRRLAFLLAPHGRMLFAVHNAQHHSTLKALLRGDLQYGAAGILDRRHRTLFTFATLIKAMMDAGLMPRLLTVYIDRHSAEFAEAMGPLLRHLGIEQERSFLYFNAQQYVFEGVPLNWPAEPEEPITFVVCSNSEDVLRDNLLASPCLAPGSAHEVIVIRDATSAGEGLNRGIAQAKHGLVVCVHQDVYLPEGWPARFAAQFRAAERQFGAIGVAGVYGTRTVQAKALRFGHVMDRHNLLWEPPPLPAPVETLDELLLAVRRDGPLRFDPALGFHFYGVDMACQARQAGLAAVALDAPCFHNSQLGDGLPQAFHDSAAVFRGKWAHLLPIATASDVVR